MYSILSFLPLFFLSLPPLLCLCNLSRRYSFWRSRRPYFWVLSHYCGRLFCCAGLLVLVPPAGEGHNPAQTGRSASLGLSTSAYDPASLGEHLRLSAVSVCFPVSFGWPGLRADRMIN